MKNKLKISGQNFLHPHPTLEQRLGLDEEHVIVDRKDMEEVIKFFEENPQYIQYLGK